VSPSSGTRAQRTASPDRRAGPAQRYRGTPSGPIPRRADLAGETILLFQRHVAPGYYDLLTSACLAAGFTPRVFHPGALQTNLALISAGLGVSLLPASIRNLRRTGVVYRPLAPPVPEVSLALAYRRDERSAVVPAFAEVVHEVVRGSAARRRRGGV
jgi:DNA-binding transcriptional LysR family regulator